MAVGFWLLALGGTLPFFQHQPLPTTKRTDAMQDFRNLEVWQRAHQVVLAVYRVTTGFPSGERFGLTSQMRRCAVSIPSNIAEGSGRDSDPDFARFLRISMGSASELDYQLLLARDLGFMDEESYDDLSTELARVKRMLNGLLKRLDASRPPQG